MMTNVFAAGHAQAFNFCALLVRVNVVKWALVRFVGSVSGGHLFPKFSIDVGQVGRVKDEGKYGAYRPVSDMKSAVSILRNLFNMFYPCGKR